MIYRSPYPDVAIPETAYSDYILADAGRWADQPAFIDGPSGRSLSFAQVRGGARKVAASLAARGFAKGERFALFCPNLPEYAVAFHGVALAGGVGDHREPAAHRRRTGGAVERHRRALPADGAALHRDRAAGRGTREGGRAVRARPGRWRDPVRRAAGHRRSAPGGGDRPARGPARAALFQRHQRTIEGRDADAPQRRGRAGPVRPVAGPESRRSNHRGAAVLPHLRPATAERGAAPRRLLRDDATLRPGAVPAADRAAPRGGAVHSAADGAGAGQASAGGQLRPVVRAQGRLRRRAARCRPADGRRGAAEGAGRPGPGHDRGGLGDRDAAAGRGGLAGRRLRPVDAQHAGAHRRRGQRRRPGPPTSRANCGCAAPA